MSDTINIDLANNKDNLENNMTDHGDVKCLDQINFSSLPPGGETQNFNSKQSAKDLDGEQCERKKKTRRGKPKRRNPYNKDVSVRRVRNQKRRSGNCSRFRNRQPVAPNNTNQFLMDDHTDLQELDQRLQATANKTLEAHTSSNSGAPQRPARARDSSFTSADSEEDFFYSSPEDEEEFLTKEFSNTYQDLHVEALASMTKAELIQQLLQMEEKLDTFQKNANAKNKTEENQETEDGNEEKQFCRGKTEVEYQNEITRLSLMNEALRLENEKLQQSRIPSSDSTMDSESDSSSSSDSSDSSGSDRDSCDGKMNAEEPTMNGNVSSQEIRGMESEDMT